jgi:hypothetical protein
MEIFLNIIQERLLKHQERKLKEQRISHINRNIEIYLILLLILTIIFRLSFLVFHNVDSWDSEIDMNLTKKD